MLRSFLNFCFIFSLQMSIQFSTVVSSSLSFLSTILYYSSNAKSLMFSYFYFVFLSEIIIFVDRPYVNMNFMLCTVLGFQKSELLIRRTQTFQAVFCFALILAVPVLWTFDVQATRKVIRNGSIDMTFRRVFYVSGAVCSSVCTLVQIDTEF